MKTFVTYQLAKQFYLATSGLNLPRHLKDQMQRASSSIALNLAEGSGKRAYPKEQKKFYITALGSLRECSAILDLANQSNSELLALADKLGAHLYKLIQS